MSMCFSDVLQKTTYALSGSTVLFGALTHSHIRGHPVVLAGVGKCAS